MKARLHRYLKALFQCTRCAAIDLIRRFIHVAQQPRCKPASTLMHVMLATSCNISTPGLSFGNYDVFSSLTTDGAGTISISCDATTSYMIALSAGQGSLAMRSMNNGKSQMAYNLYSTPARNTVWGDGSAGSVTVTGITATATQTVYGRISAQQNLPVGNYSDTIMMTLTF